MTQLPGNNESADSRSNGGNLGRGLKHFMGIEANNFFNGFILKKEGNKGPSDICRTLKNNIFLEGNIFCIFSKIQ